MVIEYMIVLIASSATMYGIGYKKGIKPGHEKSIRYTKKLFDKRFMLHMKELRKTIR